MKIKFPIFIAVILIVITFESAAKKPSFKKNKEAIGGIKTIYVVTDSMLMEHYSKQDVGVDQSFNNDLGIQVFKATKDLLSKQIKAEFVHAASAVGLYPEGNLFTVDTRDPQNQIILPAVDESIGIESKMEVIEKIEPLFERMHRFPDTYKKNRTYLPDLVNKSYERVGWLNLNSDEAVLMITVSGLRKKPAGSTGKTVASAVLTLGMGVYIELAIKYFNAALVNADGQLLWAGVSKTGYDFTEYKLKETLYKMYKSLPYKIKRPRKPKKRNHYSNFK